MSKRLFLIDAYALVFRAYYAFIKNPRVTSKGLNTSAIFGFTNTLIDLLKKEKPTHIAVVFDPPSPNFRHEMFPEYKANREATPEDIKIAVPYIKSIIEAFNIPVIQVDGYEADDVIGTLSKIAEKSDYEVFLMTPDKDFGQLVTDKVKMYKPGRSGNENELWGVNEIRHNFGISEPIQIIDLLALMGDASDNIPGAKGIGAKTAQKLIIEYKSAEGVIENASKIKGKVQELVINSIDNIKLSKTLATIKLDVPVEFNENELESKQPNKDKLKEIFDELEFRTMYTRILQPDFEDKKTQITQPQHDLFGTMENVTVVSSNKNPELKTIADVEHEYFLVKTKEERLNLINRIKKQKEFCFDTETTGIDPNLADLVGIAISLKPHEAYYIPVPQNQDEAKALVAEFKEIFEDENIMKIGQNIKFDILMLKWYNVEVKGKLFDTMLAHYIIQPEQRHNLDFLSENYLKYKPIAIEELIGNKGKSQISMRLVAVERIKDYSCEDADVTIQLKQIFEEELEKEKLSKLFWEIETPLVHVLADMEKTGVKINKEELKQSAHLLRQELIVLEGEIFSMAGMHFNISSPRQLGEVLFNKLQLDDDAKKTKTKQFSTSEETLMKLQGKHPIILKVLEFRSLSKLLNTYVDALPELINPKTRRIHTSYNQAVTSTGRLSSNNPNLQNIPIRDEKGREIRKAFVACDDNHLFFSADYSQIELRLMAHLSQDPSMIEAFNNNEDIHSATAAKIYKIPLQEVTKAMRSNAKTANFGIIYGISAFGLSERLQMSRKDAKILIDSYFENYPKVKEYMDLSIFEAREKGYVETIFGRRRYLPDINSNNANVRSFAERNAINAPIQGSAADIIKIAMISIYNKFNEKNLKSKMLLQVHDELNFEVVKQEFEIVKDIVISEMQNVIKLRVPLIAESGVGVSWFEAH